jgi:YfiH family protein
MDAHAADEPLLFMLAPWMTDSAASEIATDLANGASAITNAAIGAVPGAATSAVALVAGFTGRTGGVSEGGFDSLNCGLHVGDVSAAVVANRARIAARLGFAFEAWTCGEQVHDVCVHAVTASERGRGRNSRADAFQATDALMTNVPGVLLTSFYADCVPLYFWDPVHRVVALAHAGWKGTAGKIAQRTIEAMHVTYGSRPEELHGAIGPSIGVCCYEVDTPVLTQMRTLAQELQAELAGVGVAEFGMAHSSHADARRALFVPSTAGGDKARLNLKLFNQLLMIQAGIPPAHIECSEWCTGCHTDRFYSHRVEGGNTGRMASFIGLTG